jgi:ubiquinone/menaquinone biosynthesis C-methylase UbiE
MLANPQYGSRQAGGLAGAAPALFAGVAWTLTMPAMAKSRRSAVQKYHDRVAGRYDHSYDDAFWTWHDLLTWDYIKPFLPRDANAEVIDLGCGTGKWAAKLAKSGYRVTCVDISAQMLDQARQKLEGAGRGARTEFIRADLADLSSLPAHRYALAVALGDPIGCAESPRRAMKQIRRLLQENGILIATFDNRLAGIDFYLSSGDASSLMQFLRDGKTHWLTRDHDERFPIATFAPDDAIALAEGAGFKVLDLVGKTVLPMRHHRELLASSDERRKWARIERRLCRNPHAVGRASHLQLTCRVVR